jgi:exopolysaccharide biosynthesis polyprenyl glycosylphosphotransferase
MSTLRGNVQFDQPTALVQDWGGPSVESPRGRQWLPIAAGLCLITGDLGLVVTGFLLAHWVRFVAPHDEVDALGLEPYVAMALTVGLITVGLLAAHGLYDQERRPAWPRRLNAIVSAASTALALALGAWYVGDQSLSRLWLGSGWALSIALLVTWRTLAQRLYTRARAALMPAGRVLIVGANPLGQQLAAELSERYEIVGYLDNGMDLAHDGPGPRLLGPIAHLERVVHAYAVDEVVIALPAHRHVQLSRIIAGGFRRPVKVKFLPGLDDVLRHRFEVLELGGRLYVGFVPVPAVSWLKRAIDLLLTATGVVTLSPLMLAIAIAIKLDSPGPVFYRQPRVGKDGRAFMMYKFRSMCPDAERRLAELRAHNEATGPLFKIRRDPRITRVGKILRRWSLDELPQLFNVLRGEMSLVGPRPPLPAELADYEDWQVGRLRATPGLTGLWQVSGRSEVPFHDMVRLDLHYIRNWSIGLDLEILARTIPAVLTNRGAY